MCDIWNGEIWCRKTFAPIVNFRGKIWHIPRLVSASAAMGSRPACSSICRQWYPRAVRHVCASVGPHQLLPAMAPIRKGP